MRVLGKVSGFRWQPGESTYQYDVNGHVVAFYDHVESRQLRYVNNHQGQVLKRYEYVTEDATPVIRRFY